ncbi:glycosyltransferase family 9 protein [Amycolatopsis sp. H20-H5]|uniref:glycosyltransferase family 9 protein n=1 Tax=Amycolatopsis sp. H20-H5 TaxID=3046309 RepID=UPI002DBF3AC4|nr:glycosyltransferase family 9 protein [Amycolatopsis sp. H20-H5]MEC3980841.1 glycosyltransferase family 9 protein [Amycolatopsis sp. H20-H5]
MTIAPAAPEPGSVLFVRGGDQIVAREQAPLGQRLPYRRSAGDAPAPTGWDRDVLRRGWHLTLPGDSLGDTLLGLAAAVALHSVTGYEITYRGPRADLMRHCGLPVTVFGAAGNHVLTSGGHASLDIPVVAEGPPTWLDVLDDEVVQVHAALPMRYYLALEQRLGVRLPLDAAPAPAWLATGAARPGRVVFVGATSRPDRKDYGTAGFREIAAHLAARRLGLSFAMITPLDTPTPAAASGDGEVEMLGALDAADAIEAFAAAELVIGNDTGLSHLAALAMRADRTGPHVLGLYARHSHTKWTTGRRNHHAVATPFTMALSAADRCPVRDQLDDTIWGTAAAIGALPAAGIADAAGVAAGWW